MRVVNSGPVVPAERMADLFEPFRRLAPDRVESVRGVGLGLSIVRSVARAHGGDVVAIPRPTGGLDVTVSLPSAPAPTAPGRELSRFDAPGGPRDGTEPGRMPEVATAG